MSDKKFTKTFLIILVPILVLLFIIVSITNSSKSDETTTNSSEITVKFGELLDFVENEEDNILIVKTKIEPSYNNEATINQNYFNVCDLIKNQGCNKYNEIQYWAVADMTSGKENKVVSFELDKDSIDKIYNNEIPENSIDEIADHLYIHQSLR